MTRNVFAASILLFLLAGCKETIIYEIPKEFTNDLLHGDLVGRVVQKESGATVVVSQVGVIDSARINSADGAFVIQNLRIGNYDVTVRSDSYRLFLRSNVEVKGGGVAYLGDIDLSTVPELVDSHFPENNSEIVFDWRFGRITVSILFTHPMDRASVEQAFSTLPASEGTFIWGNYTTAPVRTIFYDANGGFDPGATITTFSRITSMTYAMARKDSYVDTTYTVTLSTAARDTAGSPLRFPLQFSFRTVQSYTTMNGIQTNPVHGDIDVDPINYGGIQLTFPRRMNPQSTESATFVSPPMNTIILWPEENVMRIYTGGPFLSDSTITVRVGGTARDKDGVPLGENFSFWFRTAPFQVISTSPQNGQLFVTPSQTIYLNFNSYVLLSSVQSAFSISPAVPGSFSYAGTPPYENQATVVFTPSGSLAPNTKYTVTVGAGVRDMYGMTMRQAQAFAFVTRPN